MKTIAKLMALCLLLGTLGFAQAAGAGDTKKDDTKKSDTATKPKKEKKAKKSKTKKGAEKSDAAADKGDKK